jgi:hypothetical protein
MNEKLTHVIVIAVLACFAAAHFAGCGSEGEQTLWDGNPDNGGDGPGDGLADVPDGQDVPAPEQPDGTSDLVCDEQEFDIHHEIVRLMLLLDQSVSMQGTKWSQATAALQALLENPAFYEMQFGLDAFPDGYPGFWMDCGVACLRCMEDGCGTLAPPQVRVAPQYISARDIIAHMTDPAYPQFCSNTPLVNQMEYYATGPGPVDAPEMYMDDGSNYLVVISDGEDHGCFSGDPVSALASATERNLADHDLRSFAIGFGSTTGEMAAELDAIASNGGTSYTTFLHAEDGPALEAALTDIASEVITCRYVIDAVAPSADPDLVNFYIDGVIVPMDEDCTETSGSGWHWYDADHTTVEFCGDYCTSIKNGEVGSISATFGCTTVII